LLLPCLALGLGCLLTGGARAQLLTSYALRLDGTNGYVDAGHNAAFNAFPLTIGAWIRTTNINPVAQGIVSKYFDASFNGYSLHLVNGRLNAWYLRSGANYILAPGFLPMDGGFVADGRWHHVVFTVDSAGARIFVDGVRTAIAGWTGPAGPPTQTLPLQVGRYHNYAPRFRGDIDEVSIWNQPLETNAVNYIKHRNLERKSLCGRPGGSGPAGDGGSDTVHEDARPGRVDRENNMMPSPVGHEAAIHWQEARRENVIAAAPQVPGIQPSVHQMKGIAVERRVEILRHNPLRHRVDVGGADPNADGQGESIEGGVMSGIDVTVGAIQPQGVGSEQLRPGTAG
jgi:hypothetical protein